MVLLVSWKHINFFFFFLQFHEVYIRVCKKQQIPGMDQTEFLSVCNLLESRGMLQVKRSKEVRSSKVLFNQGLGSTETVPRNIW